MLTLKSNDFSVLLLGLLGMNYSTVDSRKTTKHRRFVRKGSAAPSGSCNIFSLFLYLKSLYTYK